MTERDFHISHQTVRIAAAITLADYGVASITDGYYPSYSRMILNSRTGTILGFWAIAVPVMLPLYVGFEGWWMRKSRAALKGLWLDALLAIACFISLVALVLYAWGHYAMF